MQDSQFQGRTYINLVERDGRQTYQHGTVVCPPELNDEDLARERIDEIFRLVRDSSDEWTYTDVMRLLTEQGFEVFRPAVWLENDA